MYRNDLKENKNYFELAGGSSYGGSSYRGYNYKKCMKEIQGKSTLVLVSEGSSYRESRASQLTSINRPKSVADSLETVPNSLDPLSARTF